MNTVERELKVLKKWFDSNKLSLNGSKTKFIIFGNLQINNQVQMMINDDEIERVCEHTFLGVIIDRKLCWKPHENKKTEMSKTITTLYKTYLESELIIYTVLIAHSSIHYLMCGGTGEPIQNQH